jgi:signal transduction histidine kinase
MTRRSLPENPDRLLPFLLMAAAFAEILLVHPDYDRRIFLPLALLLPLTLHWRRRYPLAVLAVNIAAWVLIDLQSPVNEDPLALALVLVVAVYSVGAHTSGRQAVVGALMVASIALTGTIADANEGTVTDFIGNAIFFFTIFGGLWVAGRAIRRRRFRERELIVERDAGARAAVAEERARIARELHDVVAHAISVIVLQARGARHAEGAERDEALDAIEATGASALAEMRRLLHILREDDEAVALAPQPSLDGLDHLVAQVRDAGLPVELRVEGERRPLPPGVDVSAYRIVQEALTNALKHAGPARARVSIRYDEDALELEIADTGAGSGNGSGGGHGLAGMRERVAVFGGRLDSGPRTEGGYTVRARLPL